MRFSRSDVVGWLLPLVLLSDGGAARADKAGTDKRQTFLGERLGDAPLSPVLHQMMALANELHTPARPARGGNAAYVAWMNGAYRQRIAKDRAALARFNDLTAKVADEPDPRAVAKILEAFVAEGLYLRDTASDEANPAHAMEAAAGIGVSDSARWAHLVVVKAKACSAATAEASAALAPWTERCNGMAAKYLSIEDQACTYATTIGVAQHGTFCGDRGH